MKPVLIVGAGPVGLTTALGLHFYGLPFKLFEEDARPLERHQGRHRADAHA